MSKTKHRLIFLILLNFFILLLNFAPLFVSAENNYQLLEPSIILDPVDGTGEAQPPNYGLREYLKTAYLVLFVLVICASVFYLILGGLEYIMSDIPNTKLDGMSKFKKAMLGLAIAVLSYLLLKLINPDLLNFNLELPAP